MIIMTLMMTGCLELQKDSVPGCASLSTGIDKNPHCGTTVETLTKFSYGEVFRLRVDSSDNLIMSTVAADKVYFVDQDGTVSPVTQGVSAPADGNCVDSIVYGGNAMAVDLEVNLYVGGVNPSCSDSQRYKVRKIDINGQVSTFASGLPESVNSIAVSDVGDVYFSSLKKVYNIAQDGTVAEIAGNSESSGPDNFVMLSQILYYSPGQLLVNDNGASELKLVKKTGEVSSLIKGVKARSVAVSRDGSIFIAPSGFNGIIKLDTHGQQTVYADNVFEGGEIGEIYGGATMTVDSQNNIYVSDIDWASGGAQSIIKKISK